MAMIMPVLGGLAGQSAGSRAKDSSSTQQTISESELELAYYNGFDGNLGDAELVSRQGDNEDFTAADTDLGVKPEKNDSLTPVFCEGEVGQALYLDKSSSYGAKIPVPDLGASYTISFWVKPMEEIKSYVSIFFVDTDIISTNSKWLSITKTGDGWMNGYACPAVWSWNNINYDEKIFETPWYAYQNEEGTWCGDGEDEKAMALEQGKWTYITVTVDDSQTAEYGTVSEEGYVCSSKATTYVNGVLYGTGTVVKGVYGQGEGSEESETYLGIDVIDAPLKACFDEVAIYKGVATDTMIKESYEKVVNQGGSSIMTTPTVIPTSIPTSNLATTPTPTSTVIPTSTPTSNLASTPTPVPTWSTASDSDKETTDTKKLSFVLGKVKNISAIKSKKKTISLSWKKVSKAKGYQIEYGTDKKFKKKNSKVTKKTKAVLSKLNKKKTYYIRVRAYSKNGNEKIYGKWSATKKVKMKKG